MRGRVRFLLEVLLCCSKRKGCLRVEFLLCILLSLPTHKHTRDVKINFSASSVCTCVLKELAKTTVVVGRSNGEPGHESEEAAKDGATHHAE